jgi:hypothetical protein
MGLPCGVRRRRGPRRRDSAPRCSARDTLLGHQALEGGEPVAVEGFAGIRIAGGMIDVLERRFLGR